MAQHLEILAASIVAAMAARENSYDHAAADKAKIEADTKNAELHPLSPAWTYVDFGAFYTKTLRQATESVVEPALVEPVHLLLHYAPNDAQAWAESVLSPNLPVRGHHSDFALNGVELAMLAHHNYLFDPYEAGTSHGSSRSVEQAYGRLTHLGLIEEAAETSGFRLTAKGRRHVNILAAIALPGADEDQESEDASEARTA